jgi:hypothetical protein
VIERARQLSFADALAAAALGLVAAGLVVAGDGLVAAAQRTPGSSTMSWSDRLLLGLWNFRLEHTLWFTLGLIVLWVAMGIGGRFGDRTDQVARLAGGVAVGFMLLAAAVALGSTVFALLGSVGSGPLEVTASRNERIFTWLLQVSTAAALALTWGLAGSRLGERMRPWQEPGDDSTAGGTAASETGEGGDGEHEPADDGLQELSDVPPPPPPPVPLRPPVAEPAPPPTEPVAAAPASPAEAARRVYQERLAYSPRRDEAKRLLDEIGRAEREGRSDDLAGLVAQLEAL